MYWHSLYYLSFIVPYKLIELQAITVKLRLNLLSTGSKSLNLQIKYQPEYDLYPLPSRRQVGSK